MKKILTDLFNYLKDNNHTKEARFVGNYIKKFSKYEDYSECVDNLDTVIPEYNCSLRTAIEEISSIVSVRYMSESIGDSVNTALGYHYWEMVSDELNENLSEIVRLYGDDAYEEMKLFIEELLIENSCNDVSLQEKILEDSICGKVFKSSNDYNDHISNQYNNIENILDISEYKSKFESILNNHSDYFEEAFNEKYKDFINKNKKPPSGVKSRSISPLNLNSGKVSSFCDMLKSKSLEDLLKEKSKIKWSNEEAIRKADDNISAKLSCIINDGEFRSSYELFDNVLTWGVKSKYEKAIEKAGGSLYQIIQNLPNPDYFNPAIIKENELESIEKNKKEEERRIRYLYSMGKIGIDALEQSYINYFYWQNIEYERDDFLNDYSVPKIKPPEAGILWQSVKSEVSRLIDEKRFEN